jgi:hypothetical protein
MTEWLILLTELAQANKFGLLSMCESRLRIFCGVILRCGLLAVSFLMSREIKSDKYS